jgi:hypothetical protein
VSAIDAAANESPQSSPLAANTDIQAPVATLTQPTCNTPTGTITITSPTGPGIEYSINNGSSWTATNVFSNLTANTTYPIRVRNANVDPACVSSGNFTINALPSPPSPPTVSSSSPVNVCPSVTINLTTLVTSTTPTGGSILFKTSNDPLGANVANPATVGAGSYYIFYQNQAGCFSTGTAVAVNVNDCPPDITPSLIVSPNIMHGVTSFNLTVKVTELNIENTNGLITVNIPKDPRWELPDGFNPALTVIGTTPVNNNQWAYSSDAVNHIFSSSSTILAGGFSTFGFRVSFDPRNTRGIYTITSQLVSGSGGEIRVSNNVDSEKVDYFQE